MFLCFSGVPSPSTNAALGGSPSSSQHSATTSSSPPPPTVSPTVVKSIDLNVTPAVKVNHRVHPQITSVVPIPTSNFPNATISPSRSQQPAKCSSPSDWTIEEVIQFIETNDPILAVHAELFRKHVSFLYIV